MGHMETKKIIFSHFQKHRLDKFVHRLTIGQELPSHITYSPSCSHLPTLLFPDKLTYRTYAGAHGNDQQPLASYLVHRAPESWCTIACAYNSIKHKKKPEWMEIKNSISLDEEFVHSLDNQFSLYMCAHSCIAGSIKRHLFLPCLPFGRMHQLLLKRDG
jgi:hypothetical protein